MTRAATSAALRPIDPLAATSPGLYEDEMVVVSRGGRAPAAAVHTRHFSTWNSGGVVHLVHHLRPDQIDNDLAGVIAGELFSPGWLGGSEVFERVLTGVVLTSHDQALDAWELFYRNTLARLDALRDGADTPAEAESLAAYAPVYSQAASLVRPGHALELGSCFGFLSLQLADQVSVTASDVTANTVRLLAAVAPRLGLQVDTIICDAARVPSPPSSYDSVLAVHLLEHLEPEHGKAVLAEMIRLARQRVIVAVPFEAEPTAAFGHVRVFDLDDLRDLGEGTGWTYDCYEHHGGWLVLDRP